MKPFSECKFDKYKCQNGPCIHRDHLCDGNEDCPGGDDERHRKCGMRLFSFKISNEVCLQLRLIMANTTNQVLCKPGQFKCLTDNRCVPSVSRCNTKNDCEDKSDEKNCCKNMVLGIISNIFQHFKNNSTKKIFQIFSFEILFNAVYTTNGYIRVIYEDYKEFFLCVTNPFSDMYDVLCDKLRYG